MKKRLFFIGLIFASPALALSPQAQEFMAITQRLEPVQCEKRKLRRSIALAEAERRDDDVRALRRKFADLDKNPETARLEKRLGVLEPRVSKAGDAEDLAAISRQQREAFYRCE
ncbi:MAG TPA: hypothetical protein VET51_10260 [Burkholderiales bacterium]|nr:hypothetical protein [Burkholderiales bacterium]